MITKHEPQTTEVEIEKWDTMSLTELEGQLNLMCAKKFALIEMGKTKAYLPPIESAISRLESIIRDRITTGRIR